MEKYKTDFLTLHHCDCMELMKQTPDNYYSLALVDPPYGLNLDGGQLGYSKHEKKNWDSCSPPKEYFDELFRVSKNQIIWGFNHFLDKLPNTKAVIFWNKHQNGYFAEGELAWCSIGTVKYYDRAYQKDIGNKIHPTQKPIDLYDWILKNYAKQGDKILDTHFGSGSIALAVHKANQLDKMNLHLTACEIDEDYIEKAIQRINLSIKQTTLNFIA